MTFGKFLLRWVVVFVAVNVLGFIGHGTLLRSDYLSLGSMMRPQSEA